MAEVTHFTLVLSANEIRAVHYALGRLTHAEYGNVVLAMAGSDVRGRLTPFADEENWDD